MDFWKYLFQLADSKDKANWIQNIAFPASVQASDRIKLRIPTADTSSVGIRFEAIYNEFLDAHGRRARVTVAFWSPQQAAEICQEFFGNIFV